MTKPTHTYTDTDNLSSKLGTAQPQLVDLTKDATMRIVKNKTESIITLDDNDEETMITAWGGSLL